MLTSVDGTSRRRRWLPRAIAIAVLVAAAALLLVRLDVIGPANQPSVAQRAEAINVELTRRMTTTLEQLPATGHQGHGGQAGPSAAPVKTVCAARVYGYEPATAASVADVVTVYGFHMCGLAQPGQPWEWATKFVAPLVMRMDTQPPAVEMAESTAEVTYRDRVKQLIPQQYQDLALEGALSPEVMAELRRRYDAAAGI